MTDMGMFAEVNPINWVGPATVVMDNVLDTISFLNAFLDGDPSEGERMVQHYWRNPDPDGWTIPDTYRRKWRLGSRIGHLFVWRSDAGDWYIATVESFWGRR